MFEHRRQKHLTRYRFVLGLTPVVKSPDRTTLALWTQYEHNMNTNLSLSEQQNLFTLSYLIRALIPYYGHLLLLLNPIVIVVKLCCVEGLMEDRCTLNKHSR